MVTPILKSHMVETCTKRVSVSCVCKVWHTGSIFPEGQNRNKKCIITFLRKHKNAKNYLPSPHRPQDREICSGMLIVCPESLWGITCSLGNRRRGNKIKRAENEIVGRMRCILLGAHMRSHAHTHTHSLSGNPFVSSISPFRAGPP